MPYCFCTVTSEHVSFLSIRYDFFSPFPLFLLSAFLTGAPLDSYHIYWCFNTFRQTKNFYRQFFPGLRSFLGKVISEPEACIEETIGSILFESIQSFSPFILQFMYCVDNCLLLAVLIF